MRSSHVEFLAGIRAELPILLGVIPLGTIVGVLARSAGLSAGPTLAMSAIVFSGAAQLVAVQLMATGTPGAAIVLTAGVVNLRHLLYSASMAPHFRHLGLLRQGLLAYLLADEAYAVAISHYQHSTSPSKHWYFLGAGLVLWILRTLMS
jgi:4-azaleucine resistance transporter AzlC